MKKPEENSDTNDEEIEVEIDLGDYEEVECPNCGAFFIIWEDEFEALCKECGFKLVEE